MKSTKVQTPPPKVVAMPVDRHTTRPSKSSFPFFFERGGREGGGGWKGSLYFCVKLGGEQTQEEKKKKSIYDTTRV